MWCRAPFQASSRASTAPSFSLASKHATKDATATPGPKYHIDGGVGCVREACPRSLCFCYHCMLRRPHFKNTGLPSCGVEEKRGEEGDGPVFVAAGAGGAGCPHKLNGINALWY